MRLLCFLVLVGLSTASFERQEGSAIVANTTSQTCNTTTTTTVTSALSAADATGSRPLLFPNEPVSPPATTLLGQQDQCDPKLLRAHRAQRSFLRHNELERRCKGDADVQDSARHGCLHTSCSLDALSGDVYGVTLA